MCKITERPPHPDDNFYGQIEDTHMIRDENDLESPKEPEHSGGNNDKSSRNGKSEDWIGELERELQEITKKWPGSQRLG